MKTTFLLIGLAILATACDKPMDGQMFATASSDLLCRSGGDLKTSDPAKNQSCISYEYDGDSTLYLIHYNAGFNCCPEQILVALEVRGDSLIITENDKKQDCRCNCLFHVNVTVHNLERTRYHVKIVEPLARIESLLVFDLDLKKKPTGQVCETRDYYPWGQ